MKLILTHEVTNLGTPGDVVEVKGGYGRNFLMPRGYAIRWTRGAEKQIESIKKARSVREVRDVGHANEIRGQLQSASVEVPAHAGAGGRLFGAVTVSDIAAALKEATNIDVDKRRIQVATPIKSLGEHTVSVVLHPEVTATVTLEVAAV